MQNKFHRRRVLQVAACAAAGAIAAPALARSDCAVFTRETQGQVSPAAALKRLQEGNARFVAGETIHCDLRRQVAETAGGQAPFAAVVGCIDSRVPPELVFDQRIGDIFAARVAGNIVTAWILTLPAAAAIGALCFGITEIFGDGAAGPVIISAIAVVQIVIAFVRRSRQTEVVDVQTEVA